jgi:hypothetical protein
VELANERGNDVASVQIEVVTRPIDVGRHDADVVRSELSIVRLAEHDAGDLGDGIRFVGRLERSAQQRVLAYRLVGEPGVDAGAPQEHELLNPTSIRALDDVELDEQVAPNEVGREGGVREDAADSRRGEKDEVRSLRFEERRDGTSVLQLEVRARAHDQVVVSEGTQPPNDRRADEAAVSRDEYLAVQGRHTPS